MPGCQIVRVLAAGCHGAEVLNATMPSCWGSGCHHARVPECWDAGCHRDRVLDARVSSARVLGCWMPQYQGAGYHCAGCQDAETPQCHISCATLRAQGSVAIAGRTLTPSPCLHRLCLPHLLRPRLRTEGSECPARAEDTAGGK